MPKETKSTKIETEKRVFTIQGWILSGIPDYLIYKNIEQSDWDIGRRQAKNLVKKAYTIWHEEQVASIEEKRSMRIAELKQDIRNMKPEFKGTPKGMAVVNSIKKEITKLEGLYRTPPVQKHILQGDPEKPIEINNSEDRRKRINELLAKAQEQQKKFT